MGYGYNTTTALLARGAREMQVYARLHGAEKSTFFGLAGIGDIMLTCISFIILIYLKAFGSLSRNR
jgi:glycerol-3-phosphate dehydrogenase (NAD(P)+)